MSRSKKLIDEMHSSSSDSIHNHSLFVQNNLGRVGKSVVNTNGNAQSGSKVLHVSHTPNDGKGSGGEYSMSVAHKNNHGIEIRHYHKDHYGHPKVTTTSLSHEQLKHLKSM